MNHPIETSVLVGNVSISRPIDVFQLMAKSGERRGNGSDSVALTNQIPELGILSRTVFASPLFNSVRHAKIRHKNLNDIVLIGQDAVQLKEIHDYGRLHHVATKSDFKGHILAAKVYGDPREVPVSVASPLPKQRPAHRGRRSMTGDGESLLPPEVIVLTLTSRTLMFLWARNTPKGIVTFTHKNVRLPAGVSRFDRFGAFLAIDPKGRAMAVAAIEGRFILYKTKSMQRWHSEVQEGIETTPIQDERIIQIEGKVIHMDFLSSGVAHDEFHVVLLFVIAVEGKTKITCFDWDCRQDLSTAAVRTERVAVDYHDHNPSLLIPLSRTADFLLIFDTHITVFRDVLSGAPRRLEVPISPDILPSLLPGDSRQRPRWVGWDKTLRNPDFPKEAFYVAREDGRIMYLERGAGGVLDTAEAGDWPYRIDTAFACLSVDSSEFSQLYPDVLIAGGVGNDGCLCKLGSWPAEYSYAAYPVTNQLSFVESIANWTPLTDLSVTWPSGISTLHERNRCSLFLAHGSSPHGEVSELRQGIQSLIDYSFSGMNGCTGLWVIDHGSETVELDGKSIRQYYAIFVVTMPPETILIRITRIQGEVRGDYPGAWEDGAWKVEQISGDEPTNDGVVRDTETITACVWSAKFAVQITREEVRILNRLGLQQSDTIMCPNSLRLAACRPGFPFVAITFRESGNTYLEVVQISPGGHFVRTTSQNNKRRLDHDPTCVELFEADGVMGILVGTFGSTLYFLRVDDQCTIRTIVEENFGNIAAGSTHMALESACLLSARGQHTLVCATRNGYLLSSCMPTIQTSSTQINWHVVKMGTTSARITASAVDTTTAFVSCGPDFCRVRCSDSNPSVLDIDSVWFINRTRPSYLQSSVTALYQLPLVSESQTTGRNLGGFIFVVAGDEFHCSQLGTDTRWATQEVSSQSQNDGGAVPRKLFIGPKPTTITHLKPIRKMVISTIEAREGQAPPDGVRVLHSYIKLLDIHDHRAYLEAETKQEDRNELANKLIAAQYELKHGERVYSVVEWPFKDRRNSQYTLILVGTGVPGRYGKETGRRLLFNVGRNESAAKLLLQKVSVYDHPVYSTAIYSNKEILSAIGKTLKMDVFDPDEGVFHKRATIDLPSPAIHVTVRDDCIHVSTLQHSHLCYEMVRTGDVFVFKRILTDSRERNCSDHQIINISNSTNQDTIVLVNDKSSSSITGLYCSDTKTHQNAAPTLFEAELPRTVVRIQQGDIRPPWRRPVSPSRGILNDDIIGACSDGTIYTFSILSKPARHLLRFLQNLIEEKEKRDPANQISGSISDVLMHGAEGNQDEKIRGLDVDPRYKEKDFAGPRFKAIDGDLVGRWLSVDGDLEALVTEGTEGNVPRLFGEFITALWNDTLDLEHGAEKVKEWLAEVFMPVL